MFLALGITLLFGYIGSHGKPVNFKWAALIWTGLILLLSVTTGTELSESFILLLAIKAFGIFVWLHLLHRTQDTIFLNLILLIGGAYVLIL